ncbi:type VI secretion system baseplate subunit TssK [soil metagenome]
MTHVQKPLWTKGVLLSQQQLQMQDRYHEARIAAGVSALSFCPWGFGRVVLDHEAMASGSVAILGAEGLFPDGLAFSIPDADVAPLPKPLESHWTGDRTHLDLFLAIPEARPGERQVSLDSSGSGTRFVAETILLRDENSGLSEKPIQFARRNLRILADDEGLNGHALLPLARVIRSQAGQFEFDSSFVPPLLSVGASDHLVSLTRRLVEILSGRSGALSGARRQRGRSLADFGVSDIANFWLLYTINTHLPEFRHIHESRRGHPARLFEAMLELAGALSTFSTSVDPRSFPAYDHGKLGERFDAMDSIIRELLQTVVPEHHVTLPLKEVEPSIHATAIDQDRYLAATDMFLAVSSDSKAADVHRKVPQLVKVSSGDQVRRLIQQALPGVRLESMPRPPSALPVKLGYEYFRIQREGTAWDAITVARNLAVYAPLDLPNPRFELVILLPRG